MKILFISSGNSGVVKPVVYNQAVSLKKQNVSIDYFLVKGKRIGGYLKNIKPLRTAMRNTNYDVVHAHYSFSAFLASVSGAKPLLVSLMGSDVKASSTMKIAIKIFGRLFNWKCIIVKSEDMRKTLGMKNVAVVPNGVNLEVFSPQNKYECRKKLNWQSEGKHILFAANPNIEAKNYQLLDSALRLMGNDLPHVHCLIGVKPEEVPCWINAADIVVLTSLWEGSPNVIKESMACNKPIVVTNVGDVACTIKNMEGCYLTSYDPVDLKHKLLLALEFSEKYGETKGRNRIVELGLDSVSVAKRIISLYREVSGK